MSGPVLLAFCYRLTNMQDMAGEFEAAADIMTGTVIGRAVEPHAGESSAARLGDCLNCGAPLRGAHCGNCGQKAQVHRTLAAFGHDIVHSVLHFDGKIWRTLPMLFWKPGDLTRRYVHGERAKFVSPLALFLFTVFLTFATFNILMPKSDGLGAVLQADDVEKEYQADRKEIVDQIAELKADKAEAIKDESPGRGWIDGAIARNEKNLKELDDSKGKEARLAVQAQQKLAGQRAALNKNITDLQAQIAETKKAGKPTDKLDEALEVEQMAINLLDEAAKSKSSAISVKGKWNFTDVNFPGATALNEAAKHAAENPQLLVYKIQSSAYKYSWALIPISVPLVWLLFFWRRRFKMFDHAVFVTYSITFMMLLGVISAVLIHFPATEDIGAFALLLVPPMHMYRQLHHAYETSRFGAFWRMCVLSLFALFALTLFATLVLALGVTS
jgi:hypothetical protein